MLYGLLVQALDTMSGRVLDLEQRQHDSERMIVAQLEAEELELAALAAWIVVE